MSEMFHAPCLSSTGAVRRRCTTDKGYGPESWGFRGEELHAMGPLVGLEDEPSCIQESCMKGEFHVFLLEIRVTKCNQSIIQDQTTWTPVARHHIRLLGHLQKHLTEQIFLFSGKKWAQAVKAPGSGNSGRGCGCWWSCHVGMDEERGMDALFIPQMESGKDFS